MGRYSSDEDRKRKKKKKRKSRSRSRSYESVDSRYRSKHKKSKKVKHKRRSRSLSSSRSSRKSGRLRSRSKSRGRSRSWSYGRYSSSPKRDRRSRRSRSRSYKRRSRSRSYGRRSRSRSYGRRSRSGSIGARRSRSTSRSYSRRSRSRSREKFSKKSRRYSRSRSRDRSRNHSRDRMRSGGNSPAKFKTENTNEDPCAGIPGFAEMSTSEQTRVRMNLALKAAAAADEKLKEGLAGHTRDSPVSFKDQEKYANAIAEIESNEFNPAAFKSSRYEKRNEDKKSTDDFAFGTAAEIKIDPTKKFTIPNDITLLAHANLSVDPEEKMDRWIEKLKSMRRKKLEGEAII